MQHYQAAEDQARKGPVLGARRFLDSLCPMGARAPTAVVRGQSSPLGLWHGQSRLGNMRRVGGDGIATGLAGPPLGARELGATWVDARAVRWRGALALQVHASRPVADGRQERVVRAQAGTLEGEGGEKANVQYVRLMQL